MNSSRATVTLALICLFVAKSYAQGQQPPVPYIDGKVKYSEVVSIDGNTAGQLYGKAKLWFAAAFKSAQDVIQLDDKENGNLLGKGIIVQDQVNGLTNIRKTWRFTVKIQVKDGRYRAEVYDITYTFEMPGNNIGAGPSHINVDEYFVNPRIYSKKGTLKDAAATFAEETNGHMNGILASIKKSLGEKMDSDF